MASLTSTSYIGHPKYDASRVNNVNGFIGFKVRLYLIYDGDRVYTIYNFSDWIENVNLMRESGVDCYIFTNDIIVTPTHMSSIYNEILAYVSDPNPYR